MDCRLIRVVLALCVMTALSACTGEQAKYEACVQRGIKYFKEWGTYPKLRNGKDAEEVARDRCKYDHFAY